MLACLCASQAIDYNFARLDESNIRLSLAAWSTEIPTSSTTDGHSALIQL